MTKTTGSKRRRTAVAATSGATALLLSAGLTACDPPPKRHIGTFTPALVDGQTRYRAEDVITESKALGSRITRLRQVVGSPLNRDVATFRAEGIESQLTIKASAATVTQPLDTAAKRETFRTDLDRLLTEYQPPLLSVENEATADNFYAGTAEEYLTELRIATEVARAHDVPVTDSGIPWPTAALVAWNHVRTTKGTVTADKFLATVFRGATFAFIRNNLTGVSRSDTDPFRHLRRDAMADNVRDAETIYAALGTDEGDVPVDFVNFHWYVPDQEGGYRTTGYTDAQALRDAVAAFKALADDKPVVTNEVGQHGLTPEAVTGTLGVLIDELHLPFVIWFDADGIPARALFDEPGKLRSNGKAFAAFAD